MKTIVIYHASCVDGFTAAWAAWMKYGDAAEYVPAQYGDAPPDVAGKDVLIVDFSYPRSTLIEMAAGANSVRVLDHHKTAEAELASLDGAVITPYVGGVAQEPKRNLNVTFDMNRSGAGMTWDAMHGVGRSLLVNYVEDRDLWRWQLHGSREISAYIGSFDFEFNQWDNLSRAISQNLDTCVKAGSAILRAQSRHVKFMATQAGRAVIGGHVVPFINTTTLQSEILGELAAGHPFACSWFQRADGAFVYSLRSRDGFDCSAIAKQYGGGGHPGAAGFTLDYLIGMVGV